MKTRVAKKKRPKPKPPAGAKPMKLPGELEWYDVDEHRYDKCPLYARCLSYVSEEGWDSFSCRSCTMWPEELIPELEEW